ncbi:hypothetical protein H8959_015549 [Pygathrix nigripes]
MGLIPVSPRLQSGPPPPRASGRERKRLRMESKLTIGEGQAAFPPGGAEGTCRGRFLSAFPVPPRRPAPHPLRPLRQPRAPPAASSSRGPRWASAGLRDPRCPPPLSSKGRAERRRPSPGSPSDWKGEHEGRAGAPESRVAHTRLSHLGRGRNRNPERPKLSAPLGPRVAAAGNDALRRTGRSQRSALRRVLICLFSKELNH